ncbi:MULTISPECIES: hypothetical protein [Rhizobium]|uniref:Uncharacterized protein n=1 Tax=Rhizobium wenxiniae TaxID=1737357 RepID=A0A7W9YBW4_9HYPH|nr:hypothetical protein [Rhizobium wenxiniae]MBB6165695.1 hypothetical protein [Rhizobium wenxiniae]
MRKKLSGVEARRCCSLQPDRNRLPISSHPAHDSEILALQLHWGAWSQTAFCYSWLLLFQPCWSYVACLIWHEERQRSEAIE